MNCILIDKKLGTYYLAPRLHSSRKESAAIIPVSRAFKINSANNNRYGLLLPMIGNEIHTFSEYLALLDYNSYNEYSAEVPKDVDFGFLDLENN